LSQLAREYMFDAVTGTKTARRLLAALALAALLVLPGGAQATPGYDWPGMKKCGTFQAEYEIWVYAKNIRCAKARQIQKEYWLGVESDRVIVNGGSGAAGYVLLGRFPGWRCGSGAGGGACSKGRKIAGYQN
jgi:hypothetical protein